MNSEALQEKLRYALNRELIKRHLTRYFTQKGFTETFNRKIYPPQLQDLTVQIPQLMGKVEVQPFVEDLDPATGVVRLGWNLFVLGNRRMALGYSTHTNLSEVRTAIAGPLAGIDRGTHATPKRVLNFIVNVLAKSQHGDISTQPKHLTRRSVLPLGTGELSGFYRTSNRAF